MNSLQRHIIDTLHAQPHIDPEQEVKRRVAFIQDYLQATGTDGLVLGISGGQDSTLAGRLSQLAVEALREKTGAEVRFIAMRLPYGVQQDETDARRALQFIQPDETVTYNIQKAVDESVDAYQQATGNQLPDFVKGNAKARMRMIAQYEVAGARNLLVVGTDHAAEGVTGFFTKYGDGACDLTPLSGLNKRQGKQLLQHLGADPLLYEKTPTADLLDDQPGRSDETELQLTYDQIDDYLEGKNIESDAAARLERKFLQSRHKRTTPVSPFDTWWKN